MKEKLIELNSSNLLFNLDFYTQKTEKQIIAIIKDNAYGHGFEQVTSILNNTNIKMYAVANIDEAIVFDVIKEDLPRMLEAVNRILLNY